MKPNMVHQENHLNQTSSFGHKMLVFVGVVYLMIVGITWYIKRLLSQVKLRCCV